VKRTRVETICDVHGDEGAASHTITLDGVTRNVDLCSSGTQDLFERISPYVAAARRLRADGTAYQRIPSRPVPVPAQRSGHNPDRRPGRVELPIASTSKEIRAWWRKNPRGLPQWRAMGPFPQAVSDAYKAAMAGV
jgi:Lsr2